MKSLKQRMENIWSDSDLLRIPIDSARRMGFTDEDAELLAEVGLPCWAAPNMHIHYPAGEACERIPIGEDGDDRLIFYHVNSRDIEVRAAHGVFILLARGVDNLLELLISYAEMVDAAIHERGRRAFVDNDIPEHLIAEFKRAVTRSLGSRENYWDGEVRRLERHQRG